MLAQQQNRELFAGQHVSTYMALNKPSWQARKKRKSLWDTAKDATGRRKEEEERFKESLRVLQYRMYKTVGKSYGLTVMMWVA